MTGTVLHITPHFGGGVGKVILNYLDRVKDSLDFVHRVVCLEYANEKALSSSRSTGFHLMEKMSSKHADIITEIGSADIVLVHWWNHPLLYDLLVRETLPPARIIFWSHIAGFHAPYVFSKPALDYPDYFVFTTPVSLETEEVKAVADERRRALRVIWSTGGIEQAASVVYRPHSGFNIGYIGTVDYSKLHPDFLKICSRINLQEARFTVCGGPNEKGIYQEAVHLGIDDQFNFTGHVSDITSYLAEFDIFGYPLAPYHWGTCEQALCESMAAGIPPIVMDNRAEAFIVEDGVTGLVAADEDEYVSGVRRLFWDTALRKMLSYNAKETAMRRFGMEDMVAAWHNLFSETMTLTKSPRQWHGTHHGRSADPSDVFIESLGTCGDIFERCKSSCAILEKEAAEAEISRLLQSSLLWQSKTRGTPQHYSSFFPEDKYLNRWNSLSLSPAAQLMGENDVN